MITVSILINGNPIYTRSAVNVGHVKEATWGKERRCDYELDDGSHLQHSPSDGAVKLAKMMLDTICETGATAGGK